MLNYKGLIRWAKLKVEFDRLNGEKLSHLRQDSQWWSFCSCCRGLKNVSIGWCHSWRFGHLNFGYLLALSKRDMVLGLPHEENKSSLLLMSWQETTSGSFSCYRNMSLFSFGFGAKKYFFESDYSRKCGSSCLTHKDQAFENYKVIYSDWIGVFITKES